jgi:hypothetical protein
MSPEQVWSQHLAAQEPSGFFSVTSYGETLYGMWVQGIKTLILLGAFFLPIMYPASQQLCFFFFYSILFYFSLFIFILIFFYSHVHTLFGSVIYGVHAVCFCALVAILGFPVVFTFTGR